uniref:Uncharacterized protein n=1 Tax=Arundo donax TaxID=35708 RepID=A0A0A9F9S1_ARUDO
MGSVGARRVPAASTRMALCVMSP